MTHSADLLSQENQRLRSSLEVLEEENRRLREELAHQRTLGELLHEYAYAGRLDASGQLQPEWVCDAFEQGLGSTLNSIRERG